MLNMILQNLANTRRQGKVIRDMRIEGKNQIIIIAGTINILIRNNSITSSGTVIELRK